MNLYNEFKYKVFSSGNRVNIFIAINVIVFVITNSISIIEFLFTKQSSFASAIENYLAVPSYLPQLIKQPWALFTYMFVHNGIFHILFNMLWLFWVGNILEEYLNKKKLTFLYIMGGISGAFFFILAYNFLPAFSSDLLFAKTVGSSASVMAIVVATATLLPNYTISLLLLGNVKLKWLAIFYVIFDLFSLSGNNAGGHLAHLGGAAFAYFFIKSLQNGNDWSKPFENLFTKKTKLKVIAKNQHQPSSFNKKPNQSEIDAILDKISQHGYEKLSTNEKQLLFRASNKHEEK